VRAQEPSIDEYEALEPVWLKAETDFDYLSYPDSDLNELIGLLGALF